MSSWQARPAWQLPVQWPAGATASDRGRVARERLLKAAILFAMLALTVLDRFGLKLTERAAIPVGMMAMYALVAVMLLWGAAQLNFRAAVAYLAIVSVATISALSSVQYTPLPFISKGSFLFLIVLYAPFCFSLRQGAVAPELWRWTLSLFIAFAVFLGVAGIVQYLAQFVFKAEWLFDFTPLIPERLQAGGGWATEYEISASAGEAAWSKSNGFFMREPSIFSVVIAFGLLCELSLDKRKWVMTILAAALLASHAASGLVCLAAGLFFPLERSRLARAVAFALLAAGVVFLLKDTQNVRIYLNRADEPFMANTSAYCRFVAPAIDTARQISSHPWTSLMGNGPGTIARMAEGCGAHGGGLGPLPLQTTYAKVLFEYGLAGALAFGVLIIGALNRSSAPLRIRVGVGVAWVMLGANLLDGLYLLFIYIVSAMWPQDTARMLRDTAPSISPGLKSRHGYTRHSG
jgi:hypothetical protein